MDLPDLAAQTRRLDDLGVLAAAGLTAADVEKACADVDAAPGSALLVVAEAKPSALAPLLQRERRPGFVVEDMTDVDAFGPVDGLGAPPGPVYLLHGLDRGDAMRNWSPDEAAPAIAADARTPLLLVEGLHWLLQAPEALQPNHCFMTIGSRLRRPDGRLDARTPALWISGGTGRDGAARRGAPKVGWCWAGNRHTWLGFASAADRIGLSAAAG